MAGLLAFVRISTLPSVFDQPLTSARACGIVDGWLGVSTVVTPEPTRRHLSLLAGLLAEVGVAGNLVADAHLAALALEHDGEIVSFDRDFQRFSGVRHRLPG